MTGDELEDVEWAGKYMFEVLLWGFALSAAFTALTFTVPAPDIAMPLGRTAVIVVGVVGGIVGYLLILNVAEIIAARRRGLTRDEYWRRAEAAREARRLRRAQKQKREAEQTIEEMREDAGDRS